MAAMQDDEASEGVAERSHEFMTSHESQLMVTGKMSDHDVRSFATTAAASYYRLCYASYP